MENGKWKMENGKCSKFLSQIYYIIDLNQKSTNG